MATARIDQSSCLVVDRTYISIPDMALRAAYALLILAACDASELVLGFVFSLELNTKQHILVGFCLSAAALFLLLSNAISSRTIRYGLLLLSSIIFLFMLLHSAIFSGTSERVFLAQWYFVVIVTILLVGLRNSINDDFYKVVFGSISVLSAFVVVKILLISDVPFLDLVSIYEERRLTYLGFVNSFAYVCAVGILFGGIAWLRERRYCGKSVSRNVVYFFFSLSPIIYLLASKSKGGIAVLAIGFAVLFFGWRLWAFGAVLSGTVVALANENITAVFLRLMMYGRSAEPDFIIEKVNAAFSIRFAASIFFNDPIGFLGRAPFGVGLDEALAATVYISNYDVIMKTHSLLLVLIDAYGIFALLVVMMLLIYIIAMHEPLVYLGALALSIPIVFTNEPHGFYAILLMLVFGARHRIVNPIDNNQWVGHVGVRRPGRIKVGNSADVTSSSNLSMLALGPFCSRAMSDEDGE